MANVRDLDTSLWLHNKLGVSNDSWISGSICSQLNKEVLRNIKDCFPDLQTQVKLKLLLSFFHIPRRLVEEWKTELDEIIEVAGLDSELWVSMLAETMKTFPASGSLNTEISEYEETRPIFTDMVNDLKRLVSKHSDLGMLPLECQYLNKNALTSVVGQQANPVKHFTLKRKPKSVTLRNELLQKSSDAQSSLKKSSAPTIPLRTRGMPRKMTDTTPLKGIPSRVPTSGFRSPTGTPNQHRPNMSRTPAGRKDGGIKLIEFTEQPLGFAALKKRKRQLEQEEQQKKALEQKQAVNTTTTTTVSTPTTPTSTVAPTTPVSTTPDYAAGLTSVYTQPPTPAVSIKDEPVEKKPLLAISQNNQHTSTIQNNIQAVATKKKVKEEIIVKAEPEIKMEPNTSIKIEKYEIKEDISPGSTLKSSPLRTTNQIVNSLPNNISVKITQAPVANNLLNSGKLSQPVSSGGVTINSVTPVLLTNQQIRKQGIVSNSTQTTPQMRSIPLSQLPKPGGAPLIISQTIIKPAGQVQQNQQIIRNQNQQIVVSSTPSIQQTVNNVPMQVSTTSGNQQQLQYIITSSASQMPSLTSFAQARSSQTLLQNSQTSSTPTKIVIKTAPTNSTIMTTARPTTQIQSNPPPLISTQPTILNIQNVNLPNRAVTIQPASQAAQAQHIQAQLQAHQQQQQQQQQQHTIVQPQQQIQTHTVVSNTNATQQPKFTLMSPKNINQPGKTIYLAQKGVILRNIGGDMYQQIPISNVSGLNNINLGGTLVTSNAGPPTLVKTTNTIQQPIVKQTPTQIPALIPTNNLPVVITSQQQPQQAQTVQTIIGNPPQQTIIRPLMTNLQGNITTLPQGLTLIQRPGQQPQLVQMQPAQQQQQQTQLPRTIITTQQPQQQNRSQQIIIQQRPQTIITTQQPQQQQQAQIVQRQQPQQQQSVQQTQQQPQQQPQRKGLSLSNEHVIKAHEMFRKANKVSRPDKALILGFMAGLRDNPRPNPENVVVIKLGETEEKVRQDDDTYALCLVESLIRLDYNTAEWKTFQNYRRLDQPSQQDDKLKQTPNSVIT